MNRFLPLLATQIPTLWIHTSGGRGRGGGGSDIRSMSSMRPICKCQCPPLPITFRLGGGGPGESAEPFQLPVRFTFTAWPNTCRRSSDHRSSGPSSWLPVRCFLMRPPTLKIVFAFPNTPSTSIFSTIREFSASSRSTPYGGRFFHQHLLHCRLKFPRLDYRR
jgi:hypothetical protein